MRELVSKFSVHFTFDSPVLGYPLLWISIGVIWLAVVGCTYTSIFSQKMKMSTKLFWCITVTILPLVGLAIYLPFSLNEELFPYFGFWKKPRA